MGKLVTKVCDLVDGEAANVTLPQIEDEHPFPEPVKFFAVRCFVDKQPVLETDGSSCAIPGATSSVPSQVDAEGQSQTWNLRNRIDEYLDSLSACRIQISFSSAGYALFSRQVRYIYIYLFQEQ